MEFPQAMMHENIWFDKPKYDEADNHYQLYLTNNISAQLAEKHHNKDNKPQDQQDGSILSQVAHVASDAGSTLINEIAKARDSIKQSLSGMAHQVTHVVTAESDSHIAELASQNMLLREMVDKLTKQVESLEIRVAKLEGGSSAQAAASSAPTTTPAAKKIEKKDDDSDDDFLNLDDSDEDEEETEEERKRKEESLRKYHEKKANKKQVIAKSSVLIDVKPWDDETDLVEMERLVRTIEMDGLLWGASKLIPLAYGIKKLNIMCVIEDDKVSTEELQDKIANFEDYVQSTDIAAFNKI